LSYLLFHLALVLSPFSFCHFSFSFFFCPNEKGDNTMAKTKRRSYNGQMKKEIIQWPNEKRSNENADKLMSLWKRLFSFGHCIISFFIWPLYYLLFVLAIVLSPFSFDHCIISFFFWPLYYLLFHLAIVLSPFKEIIQWPNEKGDNTMAKWKRR
jgi:hypothetical protein